MTSVSLMFFAVLFLLAGGKSLSWVAKWMVRTNPGMFPEDRMHEVWATMGQVDAMEETDGAKINFARNLQTRGILDANTKNLIIVDTNSTQDGGAELNFFYTLLSPAVMGKLGLPVWNRPSAPNHLEILFIHVDTAIVPQFDSDETIRLKARVKDSLQVESFNWQDLVPDADDGARGPS